MIFHIGPWAYRVRITEEPITDSDGRELSGKAVREDQEILVAGEKRLPRKQRLNTVLHEVRHAWLFHFPKPRTEEEDCEFSAAVMAQAHQDLNEQGGAESLEAMNPPSVLDEIRAKAPIVRASQLEQHRKAPLTYVDQIEAPRNRSSGHRAQCGVCELVVGGGSIVNGKPRFDLAAGGFVIERWMYCPHCDHIQKWTEGADLEGRPNGAVVADPVFVRGKEAEALLSEHGQAVGVIVE
jgi:hypothetical protein